MKTHGLPGRGRRHWVQLARVATLLVTWVAHGAPTPTNAPPDPAEPRILLPALIRDGAVLRRVEVREAGFYFTVTTVGIRSLETTVVPRDARSIRVDVERRSTGDITATEPVSWTVRFDKLTAGPPFDLTLVGNVVRPPRGAPRGAAREKVTVTVANLLVGDVWLWELGRGGSAPLPVQSQRNIIAGLQAENVVVRMIDARARPLPPGSPGEEIAREAAGWFEIPADRLVAWRDLPAYLPFFVGELTGLIRSNYSGIKEGGRPLGIGLILVDPARELRGGVAAPLPPRSGPGFRAAKFASDASGNLGRAGVVPDALDVRERKRRGQLPPEPVPVEQLDSEIVPGPFVGFDYEDASGRLRLRRVPPSSR